MTCIEPSEAAPGSLPRATLSTTTGPEPTNWDWEEILPRLRPNSPKEMLVIMHIRCNVRT